MMLILGLMDIPHCWMQNLPGGGDKWNPPTQLCLGEHQQTPSWPSSSPQAHVACGGAVMQRRQLLQPVPLEMERPLRAGRLGLSHWAGPSVTGSAGWSQRWYRGIIVVILTKGKPVPLAWEFIYIGWGSHESDFHNITQNGPKMCHRTVTGVTCDTSRCGA